VPHWSLRDSLELARKAGLAINALQQSGTWADNGGKNKTAYIPGTAPASSPSARRTVSPQLILDLFQEPRQFDRFGIEIVTAGGERLFPVLDQGVE
jgi:hypothetical protein